MGYSKRLCAAGFAGIAFATMAFPALALDCNSDFQAFTTRAQGITGALNASAKRNKGKLDPISACPRLRSLAAVQGEMLGYMVKNKDWCHIPDEAIASAKAARSKSSGYAVQACNAVAQIAKMKRQQAQQQAAGGGPQGNGGPPAPPRLPTGPL